MDLLVPTTATFSPLDAASRAIRLARRGLAPVFDEGPVGDIERDALVEGLPLWLAVRRGWLYLARNDAWPGLHKVGCTRKSVEQRLAELSGAGVATPWRLVRSWGAYDAHGLEARAHAACAAWLFRGELFKAEPGLLASVVGQAIRSDRDLLLRGLRAVFVPGQLDALLDQASGNTSSSDEPVLSSYTS